MTDPLPDKQSANGSKLAAVFRSLRHRNFRLFFMGQSISLIGTWMQFVAVGLLIWTLTADQPATQRAFWLGFVPFIGRSPTLFLVPFVGVLVDRLNRHRLVVVTQCLAMVQAVVLGVLILAGWINLWSLALLQLMLGLINTFDVPARQSFVVEMLDPESRRDDLNNAIALNSTMVNGARLIGPTVAALLIWLGHLLLPHRTSAGEAICILINGVSYVAVIAGLLAMRVRPTVRASRDSRPLHNLIEGFRHVFGFAPMRAVLLLLALVSIAGQSYANLLPAYAEKVLGWSPGHHGFLLSAAGLGALGGAVFLAMRTSVRGLGRVVAAAPMIMGLGLLGLGLSGWQWSSLLIMPVIGIGMMVHTAGSNTILQSITDDDKRGRVMSFYSMAFMGMVPIGNLLSGSLASASAWIAAHAGVSPEQAVGIGVRASVIIGGACCILGSIWFARQLPVLGKLVHPIYVRKGIVPEVAVGLQAASESAGPAAEKVIL